MPNLSITQQSILNAFYLSRRDVSNDLKVPSVVLTEAAKRLNYESDLSVWIMQRLDDHYNTLRAEKIKQESK